MGSVFFGLVVAVIGSSAANTYYVDATGGNDGNNGTAITSAWQSLSKVNGTTFGPGDEILLKAGEQWVGQLSPKGSGSSGNPIIIDKYGTGNKPFIDGNGMTGGVVYLSDQQYWEINNLRVKNYGATQADRKGIYVTAQNPGTINHIYIRNNYVDSIEGQYSFGTVGNKANGGIYVASGSAHFNDVVIDSNYVGYSGREGIYVKSSNNNYQNQSTHVIVKNNYLTYIKGDGIVLSACDSALMENNILDHGLYLNEDYYAGIWTWANRWTVVQYNEVRYSFPNSDGESFDLDGYNQECIYQYNYSHNNPKGLILLCWGSHLNNIVRYNISENDSCLPTVSGDINGCDIYNNTFYISGNNSNSGFQGGAGGGSKNLLFRNNIVYANGTNNLKMDGLFSLGHNVLYGKCSSWNDPHKITADPQFTNGGNAHDGWANAASCYALHAGSPAINAGIFITSNGGKDFAGNILPLSGPPDIGALEYSAAGIRMTLMPAANTTMRSTLYSPYHSNMVLSLNGRKVGGDRTHTGIYILESPQKNPILVRAGVLNNTAR
jgi:hypothetical protein